MPRLSVTRKASTRRRGKKWSPVLVDSGDTTTFIGSNQETFLAFDLCKNSPNTTIAPTATVIKCGNFKCYFDYFSSANKMSNGRLFIMFKPQGISVTTSYPSEHPEYIMAWRTLDTSSNLLQTVSIQSKLKRNLNSGDAVILLFIVANNDSSEGTARWTARATTSYVCCNN